MKKKKIHAQEAFSGQIVEVAEALRVVSLLVVSQSFSKSGTMHGF
jgi:hypothetical protein